MNKPEMKIEGDKAVIELQLFKLDMDHDGQASLEGCLVLKGDKGELASEVIGKALKNEKLPEPMKAIIQGALGKL